MRITFNVGTSTQATWMSVFSGGQAQAADGKRVGERCGSHVDVDAAVQFGGCLTVDRHCSGAVHQFEDACSLRVDDVYPGGARVPCQVGGDTEPARVAFPGARDDFAGFQPEIRTVR